MSIAESYDALAKLLEYPQDMDTLHQCLRRVTQFLDNCGVRSPALRFASFLRQSTLAQLQEDYVANFDFNPAKAPYLGHHLFGDNHGKGAYMIKVKQEYDRFGFHPLSRELPDHLTVLLSFLAHLARKNEHDTRRRFIEETVLPGVRKLTSQGERGESPWLPLIETTELLLSADCKEASA